MKRIPSPFAQAQHDAVQGAEPTDTRIAVELRLSFALWVLIFSAALVANIVAELITRTP